MADALWVKDKARGKDHVLQAVRTLNSTLPKDQDEKLAIIDDANFFFANTLKQTPPPQGTGIFNAWKNAWYLFGKQYGPPTTFEYHTKDKTGAAIIAQECAHARCEWRSTGATWYSTAGIV